MTPTLFTACNALPPKGALRLRPGKAGSAAPAGGCGDGPVLAAMARTLVASRTTLRPKGAGLAWGGPARRPMTPHFSPSNHD
jgi:hypothetical protein